MASASGATSDRVLDQRGDQQDPAEPVEVPRVGRVGHPVQVLQAREVQPQPAQVVGPGPALHDQERDLGTPPPSSAAIRATTATPLSTWGLTNVTYRGSGSAAITRPGLSGSGMWTHSRPSRRA